METQKTTLHQCAMRSGTALGIFWIFNFIVFLLGLRIPFLTLLFVGLSFTVPIILFRLAKAYRKVHCDNVISFGQAFFFINSVAFFATMLTAVAHYIYFRYIDGGFIFEEYNHALQGIKDTLPGAELAQTIGQMEDALSQIAQLTPIELTFQLISQNIFFGIFLALVIAPFIMRKAPKL